MADAFDHKCSDADCIYLGKPTSGISCKCRVGREVMMFAEIDRLTRENEALRAELDNSQSLLVMINHIGPDKDMWSTEDIPNLTKVQIVQNRAALALKEPA